MSRSFSLLLLVMLLVGIDYYLFQAVRVLMRQYSPTAQRGIAIAFWSVPAVSLLIGVIAFYLFPGYFSFKVRNFLGAFVFITYISKFFAALILLLDDSGRFGRWVWGFWQKPADPSPTTVPATEMAEKFTRSEFLTKAALTLGGIHVGTMAWGILSGAHDYRVRRVQIPIKNLPRQFDGIRIGQLSDIHTGSFFNKRAVEGGVDMLLAEKPDVVFFTGDLVNNESKEVEDYVPIFGRVKAPLGVYSTLGNHDYGDYIQWDSVHEKRQNLLALMKAHELMGWRLLLDEHVPLQVDGAELGILGIQNWGAGRFAKYGNLNKALRNAEYDAKLLLSHDPSHWRAQVLGFTDIDAAFAGHTHGMQYGVEIGDFKWSPVQYRYKEWAGLYTEGDQHLYVNRGFGYIGYPGRVGILPEITIAELKRV